MRIQQDVGFKNDCINIILYVAVKKIKMINMEFDICFGNKRQNQQQKIKLTLEQPNVINDLYQLLLGIFVNLKIKVCRPVS